MSSQRIRGLRPGTAEFLFLYGGEDQSPVAFPFLPTSERWEHCTPYTAGFAAVEKMQRLAMAPAEIAGNLALRDAHVARVYEQLPTVAPRIEAERQSLANKLNGLWAA